MSEYEDFDLAPPEPRMEELRTALTTASALEDPADLDQGDFGPGRTYKSFPIMPEPPLDAPPEHSRFHDGFYVKSPRGGLTGFVPWPGSQVIWETDAGWAQDLYRPEVHSLLKEEKKEKRK